MLRGIVQNSVHQLSQAIAEHIVEVLALNEEHVHAELEWHLQANFLNGLRILVDLRLVVLSDLGLDLEELLDAVSFSEDPHIVVVHVQSLLDNFAVLLDDDRDGSLGVFGNLVIVWHSPKVHLIAAGDSILRPRKVVTLLDDRIDDVLQFRLNFLLEVIGKYDSSTLDVKLHTDEVLLERSVGVVLATKYLSRSRV